MDESATVMVGATFINLLFLSKDDKVVAARAEGDKVVVGGQTLTVADGSVTFARYRYESLRRLCALGPLPATS
jgi:hypothetical protein